MHYQELADYPLMREKVQALKPVDLGSPEGYRCIQGIIDAKLAAAAAERDVLDAQIEEWKAASGLEIGGDPEAVTPAMCEANVQRLYKELESLKVQTETFKEHELRLIGLVPMEESLTYTGHSEQFLGAYIGILKNRADAWERTAAEMAEGREFYRGLLVGIGDGFGAEAYTSDDGSVQDSVLVAKVPELVIALRRQAEEYRLETHRWSEAVRKDREGSTAVALLRELMLSEVEFNMPAAWCRQVFQLLDMWMIRTDEGWEPGEMKAYYVQENCADAIREEVRPGLPVSYEREGEAMAALRFFRSGTRKLGTDWGAWKAWLIHGAPTKELGIEAARMITERQAKLAGVTLETWERLEAAEKSEVKMLREQRDELEAEVLNWSTAVRSGRERKQLEMFLAFVGQLLTARPETLMVEEIQASAQEVLDRAATVPADGQAAHWEPTAIIEALEPFAFSSEIEWGKLLAWISHGAAKLDKVEEGKAAASLLVKWRKRAQDALSGR